METEFLWSLPMGVAVVYLALSVATFIAYARDKSAARRGRWRTPESTLQVLALLGGWPGGLAAQRLLRHKSGKGRFLAVFWLAAVANVVAVGWLLADAG